MLNLNPMTKVHVCTSPTDMRKSYNGLIYTVQNYFDTSPSGGDFYVFINKNRTRMKVLFWDAGGFCLFCKRLEKGRFKFPDGSNLEISKMDLSMIIEGIDLTTVKRLPRYNP